MEDKTREAHLLLEGYDICTPVSGSMRPLLRPRRDSAKFIPAGERIRRLDVVLYYDEAGRTILHRVVRIRPDGYLIRGDNAIRAELVKREQIFGVMEGYYRDEVYRETSRWDYRLYARLWVRLHPLLVLYKKVRRRLCSG